MRDDTTKSAEAILLALNKKRFLRKLLDEEEKREWTFFLDKTLREDGKLHFLMLWGVGVKTAAGYWEKAAVRQLERLAYAVKKAADIPVAFTFVYADTHARINKIEEEVIGAYLESFRTLLKQGVGFEKEIIILSNLWKEEELDFNSFKIVEEPEKIVGKECFSFLLKNAAKRYHGKDPREGATRYLSARLIENRILAAKFKNTLYLTYNPPEWTSPLQPNMHVLYLWSFHKGRGTAPWFMENEEKLKKCVA